MSKIRIRWDKGRGKSARVKPNEAKRLRDEIAKLPDGPGILIGGERWTKDRALAKLDEMIALDEAVARTRWELREARRELRREMPNIRRLVKEVEQLLGEQLAADDPLRRALRLPSLKNTGKPKSK